jgi:transcriptional regulator with XRE-family HTH domain
MSRSLDTLALRVAYARKARKITQGDLAAEAEMKQPDISKIERGQILQTTGIARLAAALDVPVLWLESGDGVEPDFAVERRPRGARAEVLASAHRMSQELHYIDPQEGSQRVKWGSMTYDDLPESYWAEVPDNAMADRIQKGDLVKFEKRRDARPEEFALFEDSAGGWHFRQFMPGAGLDFSAVATRPGYPPIDSKAAGLKVIGVYLTHRAPEGRRG